MKHFKTFEAYKLGVNGVGSLKNSLASLKRQNINGRYVDPEILAQGIRNEYEAITGEKYEDEVQMSMDNTIADIIGHFKLDGPDFMAAWDKVVKESVNEQYTKSLGFNVTNDNIYKLTKSLDPNGRLCKNISKGSDNVKPEFTEMQKLMEEIQRIWGEVEYTIGMSNESEVNEAKFVKSYDTKVNNAETKKDILKVYPKAKFFVGKLSHFFGELEPNLFFKAYYAKYYKEDTGKSIKGEFKITSVYSKKGSKYVELIGESVNEENGSITEGTDIGSWNQGGLKGKENVLITTFVGPKDVEDFGLGRKCMQINVGMKYVSLNPADIVELKDILKSYKVK